MPPSNRQPRRCKEESIELRDQIAAWALTPVRSRQHKTAEQFSKYLGVSKQYICRVGKSAPSDLNAIRKQIRQVMIAKALGGDVAAARYVDSLAKEEESSGAGKQNQEPPRAETNQERIIREAIERFPHNQRPQ